MDAFHPFTVYFKINFIRLLRSRIKTGFKPVYDKKILLDEDNYLNYENWPYWDNNLVYGLLNELNDNCLNVATETLNHLLPGHQLEYKTVTINQVETNVDYYVGRNNSLFVMDEFAKFIFSNDGKNFVKDMGSIAVKHRGTLC